MIYKIRAIELGYNHLSVTVIADLADRARFLCETGEEVACSCRLTQAVSWEAMIIHTSLNSLKIQIQSSHRLAGFYILGSSTYLPGYRFSLNGGYPSKYL